MLMRAPDQPVTLTPQQIEGLNDKLSELRHNINNQLALVAAVTELIQHKPEMATRLVESLVEPPKRISQEIRLFSEELERVLQIAR